LSETPSLTLSGVAVYEYDYDDRGRLVEVIKEGVIVEAYAYDANGNRTLQTSTEVGVDAESAIYTAGDQLESRGTTTYTYDANGRLNGKVEEAQDGPALTTYLYGSQGQLLQVDTSDKSIEYRHNALGQRVAKLIEGEVVERYLWQDLTTLLAVYDGQNNLKQRFEYTVGHTPTSFTQGGQRYYIQTDHLGSPRVITDNSGSVVKAIRYDSYGNITDDSNPEFEIPFGFAGGLHDTDTGLIRFGYRDYDPETGRWTARDPIGFDGGDPNLYGYVLGDPISWVDLQGLSPEKNLGGGNRVRIDKPHVPGQQTHAHYQTPKGSGVVNMDGTQSHRSQGSLKNLNRKMRAYLKSKGFNLSALMFVPSEILEKAGSACFTQGNFSVACIEEKEREKSCGEII